MKNSLELYSDLKGKFSLLNSLPLLCMRLVLAYGFYGPAIKKWKDISAIANWFEQIGIPAAKLNAYMAASTEMLGVVLLALGLGTRLIAMPLMVVMVVAIATVHWSNGFSAGDNGFEIPLYYLIMLFNLLVFGSGNISVDFFIKRNTVLEYR